jgi:hypothetical protein
MALTADPRATLVVGTEVDVFNRFRRGWVGGFEVAAVQDDRYRVRRQLDCEVLPRMFEADELRVRRSPSA